ncbi:cupin domain-containing protein [Streptomyces jietaisiensis]|uniref:Cupin domain-containing protein n=1 Tax=Streptomyces griseoaurantiacus TaxID=68213 RepID=A0ABZ1V6C0_9ACTN|nr:cupin domain-containing protein [Streptomyces jietaisiensis]
MDVISQALAGLRVGRGTVRRFRRSGPWGLRYAGLTGSGFHVILRGGAWLVTEDAPPRRAAPRRRRPHHRRGGPRTRSRALRAA